LSGLRRPGPPHAGTWQIKAECARSAWRSLLWQLTLAGRGCSRQQLRVGLLHTYCLPAPGPAFQMDRLIALGDYALPKAEHTGSKGDK